MAEHHLYDHYSDLSSEGGFQFEFYCQGCAEAWRTPFTRYAAGRLPAAIDAAGELLTRGRGGGGFAAFRSAAWDRAREAAFRRAACSASEHFHHCPECHAACCPQCWNLSADRCAACAPRAQERVGAPGSAGGTPARPNSTVARDVPRAANGGGGLCIACGRRAVATDFCPHCGAGLGPKQACRACGEPIAGAARFCPACGARRRR